MGPGKTPFLNNGSQPLRGSHHTRPWAGDHPH